MSRHRTEAFKNLKLDGSFFHRLLQRGLVNLPQDEADQDQDYDLYLMDNGVLPVLLQGLDALSRHVDKINNKAELCGGPSGGARPAFNPLTWLAQYLLRNHPAHVKDHRTPMYEKFRDLADVERGRRSLLRRRPEIEEEWYGIQEEKDENSLSLEDIPSVIQRLDAKWNLDGLFADKMPQDYARVLDAKQSPKGVLFSNFWEWFESFVWQNDLLRASAFAEAEERLRQAELEVQRAEDEALLREQAKNEAVITRRSLEEQFEATSADMYINAEINLIMHKGAVLDCNDRAGSVPFQGEHIDLIIAMLKLWGFPVLHDSNSESGSSDEEESQADGEAHPEDPPPAESDEAAAAPDGPQIPRSSVEEGSAHERRASLAAPAANERRASSANSQAHRHHSWDAAAQEAWECWSQMQGPGSPQVDSAGIEALVDHDAYLEYLVRAYPLRVGSGQPEAPCVVEVQALVEDGEGGLLVEATEQESGNVIRLTATEAQVEEIRQRLTEDDGVQPPVLAHVDLVESRIMDLIPVGESGF